MLVLLYRIQLAHPEKVKMPERSEILHSWCLPMLAKALKADEEERKALEMIESVRRLNRKYSGDEGK